MPHNPGEVLMMTDKLLEMAMQDENEDGSNRKAIIFEARKLIQHLETPEEAIIRMAWVEPVTQVTIRLASDLKLFHHLSDDPVSSETLSKLTKAEHSLIVRLINHLSATSIIAQPAINEYIATPLSTALINPNQRDAIPWITEGIEPVFKDIPTYFKNRNYRDTTGDGWHAPFQATHKTDLHMFDYLKQPGQENLHLKYRHMLEGFGSMERADWTDIYPVLDRIDVSALSQKDVSFVDIGGNMGRDAIAFGSKFLHLPGRVVCQDLPATIAAAPSSSSTLVEMMPHDFFTPQPICGAYIYFLHFVLHDWGNEDCLKILGHVREVMGPKSRLLINELCVPEEPERLKENAVTTSLDWIVLAAHGARERTEGQWRALVEEARLKVEKVWFGAGGEEAVIEVVRA